MSLVQVTCLVGSLYLCYLSWKILKFVLDVIKTTLGDNVDFKCFGEWAVVTGCTDGIGKEYAKQLAAKGLNIVLMSRTKEKLEAVASEIEKDHKVKTKIIQIDFSGGHEIYEPIGKELEGLEIGILVNNVGARIFHPDFIHNLSIKDVWLQVNVNCMSVAMLTRMIVPSMVERKKGIIMNIASVSAAFPVPMLGVYPATKAFTDKFSESLQIEYTDKGIIIQSVLPCAVATNMTAIKDTSFFTPPPSTFVRSVLSKVGVIKRCFGYWPHDLQAFCSQALPDWVLYKFAMDHNLKLRERTMKAEKEKKES